MRRFPLVLIFGCALVLPSFAQYRTGPIRLEEVPFEGPQMEGETSVSYGSKTLIIGGRICGKDACEEEHNFNQQLLLKDAGKKKAWAVSVELFQGALADHLSVVFPCVTQRDDTLYMVGGFGYDRTAACHNTLPLLTIVPIRQVIDSLTAGRDPSAIIHTATDNQMAVTEGLMVKINDFFMLYGGKRLFPIKDEYTDCISMQEWDYKNQLRTFRVKTVGNEHFIEDFSACFTQNEFYMCIPKPKEEPKKSEISED